MGESKPIPGLLRALFGLIAAIDLAWVTWTISTDGWPDDPDFLALAAILAIAGFYLASGRVRMRA